MADSYCPHCGQVIAAQPTVCAWCGAPAQPSPDGCLPLCGNCYGTYKIGSCLECGAPAPLDDLRFCQQCHSRKKASGYLLEVP